MARINGNNFDETLRGTAGDDVIRGGAGVDDLYGGDGNDVLISSGGRIKDSELESKVALSGGVFAVKTQGWENNRTPRKLADVNGDGLADIVAFGAGGASGDQVKVALAKGDGTFEAPKDALQAFTPLHGGWTNQDAFPRELADVNGDGMADIVGFSGTDVVVAMAKGDGTFGATRIGLSDNFTREDGGWNSNERTPRRLGDVNGDGLADIVGFSEDAIHVSLGRGNGTFQKARTLTQGFTPQSGGWTSNNAFPRELADVNGDGNADIVGFSGADVQVALSHGDGTFRQAATALKDFSLAQNWLSNDRFPRKLADVNGDGRADIVGFGKRAIYIALGQEDGKFAKPIEKDGFISPSGYEDYNSAQKWWFETFGPRYTLKEWENQTLTPRELADINGDGMADIVGFGNDKVWSAQFEETEAAFSEFTIGGRTSWTNYYSREEHLYGGAGNDVLNGGAGINYLNGGSGSDRFVLIQPAWNNSLDYFFFKPSPMPDTAGLKRDQVTQQIVEDFEKGIDKLDFKGATKDLRFQRRGNDTVIKLDDAEIALVKNAVIDSRDFAQTKAPALTPDQINNVSALVEAWAQRYADSVGDTVGEVDFSNVKFTQGDIIYEQKPVILVGEPKTASISFRNSSTTNQSAQVTFGADTSWQTSGANTTTWKAGLKLTGKVGWKAVVKASKDNTGVDNEVSKEISVEINGEYGKSETRTEVTGGRSFDQTSFSTNTPANSVTTANITYNRQSFDSKFTLPVDITGTVRIDLQRGDDKDIVALPIGAILQYYNPSQFASVDPRNITYRELPNGEYLAYSPTTRATVKGEVKGVVNVVGRQTVSTVIDHNLSNPASAPAAGYRGNQSNADRFWLALGGLPAGQQSVKILDFATNEDRIGIVASGVDRKADLRLSYDEASNTGKIGVGNRTLAELPGVDPRSLGADSFLFSTNGSIFDNSLPLASSNLKAMPTL